MKTFYIWSKSTHTRVLEIRTFSPERAKYNAILHLNLDGDKDFDSNYEVL